MKTDLEPLHGLDEHLARWVADGVVTPSQADLIRAEEQQLAAPRRSLATEALAYVGGALVVVASLLLAAQGWEDLSTGLRLAVVGAGAALLVAVGFLVPARPGTAGERFRSAVWVLSVGAAAFFLGLLGDEVLGLEEADLGLFASGGAAALAAVLWRWSSLLPQHAAVFVTLLVTAATLASELQVDGEAGNAVPGAGMLAVGGAWLLLAGRGPLVPARFARVVGALGVVMAGTNLQASTWSRPLALLVVAGLVTLALRVGDLALLGVATLGIFAVLPALMVHWFPGAVAAPLALLVCGALLVLVALRALRAR